MLSNPNSPFENEKIEHEIEQQKNVGRIDLDIPDEKSTAKKKGKRDPDIIGMGPNHRQN